ncbi:hypothetical protein B0T21DRAFT_6165 [Apiosordaria backusii]|uniref:Uncharacterized protein n=1 Tax=Apiosordaria backusii TaxID=314023 RepID=A0AA40EXU7_9PEZI|nr:hypothetical protein B0T21DRAFT_6165 [Apiosordaria backusii]
MRRCCMISVILFFCLRKAFKTKKGCINLVSASAYQALALGRIFILALEGLVWLVHIISCCCHIIMGVGDWVVGISEDFIVVILRMDGGGCMRRMTMAVWRRSGRQTYSWV